MKKYIVETEMKVIRVVSAVSEEEAEKLSHVYMEKLAKRLSESEDLINFRAPRKFGLSATEIPEV